MPKNKGSKGSKPKASRTRAVEVVVEEAVDYSKPMLPSLPIMPMASVLSASMTLPAATPTELKRRVPQELFTLFWSLLDKKNPRIAEISDVCKILDDFQYERVSVDGSKRHKSWQELIAVTKEQLLEEGGVRYLELLRTLGEMPLDDRNAFYDSMEDLFIARGAAITGLLEEGVMEYNLLPLCKKYVPEEKQGVPLEKLIGFLVVQARLECVVGTDDWDDAALRMLNNIDKEEQCKDVYQALITQLARQSIADQEHFYAQVKNILGETDQADGLIVLFRVSVDEKLEIWSPYPSTSSSAGFDDGASPRSASPPHFVGTLHPEGFAAANNAGADATTVMWEVN